MGERELWYFVKSTLQILSVMYGQIDNSVVSRFYTQLRDPESEVVVSYAIHWWLVTTLTTIILMNLLVGLTIGDVREIDNHADCYVIQIELKRMYRKIVWRNIHSCFCKCFWRSCRTKLLNLQNIVTMYPNENESICMLSGKRRLCGRFFVQKSRHFILGCRTVKKIILQHYK